MANGGASLIGVVVGVSMIGLAAVAPAEPPIRIGATLSRTGAYASLGANQLRGYQLCVKHTNEHGGALGRKLDLVVYDDESDPTTAARLYERLIVQDRVDVVLGPYSGPITEAAARVTEERQRPMVAPSASATSIWRKGRRFVFQVQPHAEGFLEGLLDLAAKRGSRRQP